MSTVTKLNLVDTDTCPACEGDGKFYVDKPDPVEGHKMSRTVVCQMCAGEGYFSEDHKKAKAIEAYWNVWNVALKEEYLRKVEEAKKEREVFKQAIGKLSFDEIQVVKKLIHTV